MSAPTSVGDRCLDTANHVVPLTDVVTLDDWPTTAQQERLDRALSQTGAGAAVGLVQSYVSGIESGTCSLVNEGAHRLVRYLGYEVVLVRRAALEQWPCIPGTPGTPADGGPMANQDRLTLLEGYDPSRITHLAVDDALDLACEHPAVLLDLGAERYDEAAIRLDEIAATAARAARRCRLAAAEVGR